MRESGVHRLHPQSHKHWPKTFGEPFGEFASHMYLRCLALHSEVSDKVSDYAFGLRTVSDKVSDYAFVHSRTVRPKSPPSQSMWKMGHIRKGCLIRGPLNKSRFSSTPKTWQLSQVCGGGGGLRELGGLPRLHILGPFRHDLAKEFAEWVCKLVRMLHSSTECILLYCVHGANRSPASSHSSSRLPG